MRSIVVNIARTALFLAVGLFFLALAFRDISFEELVAGLRSANYAWVMISLLFASLAFISRAIRWTLLIEPLGCKPSVTITFYSLMTGYLANFIFPRIGELTRCAALSRSTRISAGDLLGTVITERVIDMVVLLILCAAVILIRIELFGNFLYDHILYPIYIRLASWLDFSLFLYILGLTTLIALLVIYHLFSRHLVKNRFAIRLKKIAGSILKGMKTVFLLKKTLLFTAHTIFIWLMYYLMTWSVFMAIPATAELGGTAALFIMVIGGLGMSVPVQGGIGTYHWIVSVGLGLYGINREEGLIFATLSHESQALLIILLGLLSIFMIFRTTGKSNNKKIFDLNLN